MLLPVSDAETLGSLKPRLAAKLGLALSDLDSWRFFFYAPLYSSAKSEYLEEDSLLAPAWHAAGREVSLIMEHEEPKSSKRIANYRSLEKPISIRG